MQSREMPPPTAGYNRRGGGGGYWLQQERRARGDVAEADERRGVSVGREGGEEGFCELITSDQPKLLKQTV